MKKKIVKKEKYYTIAMAGSQGALPGAGLSLGMHIAMKPTVPINDPIGDGMDNQSADQT